MAEGFKSFVGIDVSETWLEVCVLPQATRRRFAQDAHGWQALAQMLAGQSRCRWWSSRRPAGSSGPRRGS